VLFISTLRYDTEGGRDIYISYRVKENSWSEPVNLGKNVNTAMDEYAPFYSESESALYFSSAGYAGYGEGDIYRVTRLDSTWNNWSTPVNLGPDVNTSFDEKYYYFDEQDSYAFLARDDADSVYHILRMERPEILEMTPMVVLQGDVVSQGTGDPVSSEITIKLLPGGKVIGSATSDAGTGGYEVQVPSGHEYAVSVTQEGFDPYNENLFLENRGEQYIYEYDISLSTPVMVAKVETEPVVKFNPDKINEVYFDFNAYVPRDDESFAVIEGAVDFLKKHEEYKVEITGFTDPVGSQSYNKRLSQRRADRVKRIMVEQGIKRNRITTQGMGVDPGGTKTDDDEKLRQFRRVHIRLIH